MSLLSFKAIKQNIFFNFTKLLNNNEKYLAHLSKDETKKESLIKHSNLVLEYALKLIESHDIEKNINDIISLSTDNSNKTSDIKLFFLKAIYWHDIGKINDNFQVEKMKNDTFSKIENGISSKHSILSSYLYLISSFDYINKNYLNPKDKIELLSANLYFSIALWRHHTGLFSSWKEFLNDGEGLKSCKELYKYVDKLNMKIDEKNHQVLMNNLKEINLYKNENYYFLSKLLFSVLVIADYYATAQFMNYGNKKELVYKDFGLIDDTFRDKAFKEFYTDKYDDKGKQLTFNQALKDKSNANFKSFEELQEKSNDNLNHLRNKLFVEVRTNLLANIDKNLFYIEAPTGAGKTNLSMMSVVEILQRDKSINKVFYVFPFTTLITQTFASIKRVLNLKSDDIVELHSKAKYNTKESKKDGVYGDERKNFLDNQFMNYPITLLSHVKFFDILTGVSKDDNYIFHRLTNSIVVIDEIQTYNPTLWSNMSYLLESFAKKFNIKFIVMSATLPKIGDIIDSKFVFLVKNKKEYFQNPNFAKRVEIDTYTIKIDKPKDIYKKVEKESKNYQEKKGNVKTIIEFITKKGADEFYQEAVKKNKGFFDDIFILSGTILEPRRREIIDYLKNHQDKNVLLVTTQVVEAGVDIDMDIGFKEKSLIDSDEQLAGRINRNSSKNDNKLFLFEMKNPKAKIVYKGDKRLEVEVDEDVLKNKDFDKYYNKVIKKLKEQNNTTFIENLNSYIDHIKNLRFSKTHIKIINIESISVYVPLNLMAKLYFNAYKHILQNNEQDFTKKKIKLKKLASKLSKYTFSLAKYQGCGIENLQPYCKEEYGYLVIKPEYIAIDADFDDYIIYTYKNGLNTKVLQGENVGMFI